MTHTIYYDASCPFCQKWKQRIEKWDQKHIFSFEPLDEGDTMILVESNGKKWLRGKAVFRIFWLLGWYVPGVFYLLPSCIIDPIYRLISKHRHQM